MPPVLLAASLPTMWETPFGDPLASALFSTSAACFGIWFFSITDRSKQAAKERGAFKGQQRVRAETGLGASKSSGH